MPAGMERITDVCFIMEERTHGSLDPGASLSLMSSKFRMCLRPSTPDVSADTLAGQRLISYRPSFHDPNRHYTDRLLPQVLRYHFFRMLVGGRRCSVATRSEEDFSAAAQGLLGVLFRGKLNAKAAKKSGHEL